MPPAAYSRTQIRLHWAVFVLIALQFIFHEGIAEAWEQIEETGAAAGGVLVLGHVAGGIAILALVVWRLVLRARHGVPPPLPGTPAATARLAALAHGGLYVLMLAMVATGALAWFGGIGVAAEAHEVLRVGLIALIALHVGAAIWHHFVRRDGVLARMR
ncbi:MAG: cytochrome b [Gemmobacter sp.]